MLDWRPLEPDGKRVTAFFPVYTPSSSLRKKWMPRGLPTLAWGQETARELGALGQGAVVPLKLTLALALTCFPSPLGLPSSHLSPPSTQLSCSKHSTSTLHLPFSPTTAAPPGLLL